MHKRKKIVLSFLFALFLRHNRWPSGDRACRPLLYYLFLPKVIAFRQFAKIFKKLTFKVLIFQSDAKQWWHTRWEKRPNFSQVSGFSQAELCIACLRFFLSTFPPFLLFKSPARSKSVGTIEYLITVQYKIMEKSLSYGFQRRTIYVIKLMTD